MWSVTMHVVPRLCFSGLLAFWLFLISEPLDENTLLLVLIQILLDPQQSFLDNFLIEDLFKAILPFEQQLHIFNRISSLVANAVRHFGVAFTCAIWFLFFWLACNLVIWRLLLRRCGRCCLLPGIFQRCGKCSVWCVLFAALIGKHIHLLWFGFFGGVSFC